MKTLKYRSVFSTLCVAMLSVFLFTSCEKESEAGPSEGDNVDRFEKFRRLSFTKLDGSNSTAYAGSNGSITYVKSGSNGNTFAQTSGSATFSDPSAGGVSFSVSSSFGEGGGSAVLDGETYNMDFAFCASADFLGFASDLGGGEEEEDEGDDDVAVDIFIGLAGDFNLDFGSDSGDTDTGLDMILYALSYNDGSNIGGYDAFSDGDTDGAAFVIAVTFGDEGETTLYFATEGSAVFAGSQVNLDGVKMIKLDDSNELTEDLVDLRAELQCVTFEDE